MPCLLYERHPAAHYAIFTMNRPDRLNAQGVAMRQELESALTEFTNDPEMRVGIVTGAGKAFSAGADLREMSERNTATDSPENQAGQTEIPPEVRMESMRLGQPFSRNPKPFIAAVNGVAIATGMELAADCDIRVGSTDAYFGLFEVKRGILANYAMNNLARLMLTSDTMNVDESHRLGFIHEVLEPGELMPRAVEIAETIGANAPLAVQGTKSVAQFRHRFGLEESLQLNAWVAQRVLSSDDAKEGPLAFAEKRLPIWKGY